MERNKALEFLRSAPWLSIGVSLLFASWATWFLGLYGSLRAQTDGRYGFLALDANSHESIFFIDWALSLEDAVQLVPRGNWWLISLPYRGSWGRDGYRHYTNTFVSIGKIHQVDSERTSSVPPVPRQTFDDAFWKRVHDELGNHPELRLDLGPLVELHGTEWIRRGDYLAWHMDSEWRADHQRGIRWSALLINGSCSLAMAFLLTFGARFLIVKVFPPRPPNGSCSKCRYDLTGLDSLVCPECGHLNRVSLTER